MNRRTALALLGAGLLSACTSEGPERSLTIAAGEQGGFYLAFGQLLAEQLTAAQPRMRCRAVETSASLANIDMLRAGKADMALVLADAATANSGLCALGRVYENYMQLVVRNDAPIHTVGDLAGRAVSFGASGSGASLTGERILTVAGIDLKVRHLPLADAVAALESRALDAVLWSGGVPTPKLAELDARVGIRLLPLDGVLPELRTRYGTVYEQVPVPAGGYRFVREVPTIGVANLLVCLPSLPDDVASAVVGVLVGRADHLVPEQALGTQFLDVRTLIGTTEVPLHPGAAQQYRTLHG